MKGTGKALKQRMGPNERTGSNNVTLLTVRHTHPERRHRIGSSK